MITSQTPTMTWTISKMWTIFSLVGTTIEVSPFASSGWRPDSLIPLWDSFSAGFQKVDSITSSTSTFFCFAYNCVYFVPLPLLLWHAGRWQCVRFQKLTILPPGSWYLHYQLESSTLVLLSSRHDSSLRDLQVHNAALRTCDLSNLITLHYKDLNPFRLSFHVPELLVVKNRNTLRHLKLGFEMYLTSKDSPLSNREQEIILEAQIHFYNEAKYSLQYSGIQEELGAWLCLETLHLICFDVTESSLPNFDFTNLKSLRIESCTKQPGLISLLGGLSSKNNSTWVPKLTSFQLRHEGSTTDFQARLKAFLLSFTGLIHLSLLLEGPDPVPSIAPFLRNHGKTLQTLVWDQRFEPRHLALRPTDVFQDGCSWGLASEIVSWCPNLRELGFTLKVTHDNLSYKVSAVIYSTGFDWFPA